MRKCSLASIILVILCALVVQGMGVAQSYGVVSVKLVVRDTKEEAWGYGQPIIRLAQPSGQGDTAVCTYSLVEIHAEVETLGVGDDDASGVRVEFISPSGEVHHVSAIPS